MNRVGSITVHVDNGSGGCNADGCWFVEGTTALVEGKTDKLDKQIAELKQDVISLKLRVIGQRDNLIKQEKQIADLVEERKNLIVIIYEQVNGDLGKGRAYINDIAVKRDAEIARLKVLLDDYYQDYMCEDEYNAEEIPDGMTKVEVTTNGDLPDRVYLIVPKPKDRIIINP